MLTPGYKNSFKKDLKLIKKRGKDIKKLHNIMTDLIHEKPLAKKHVDHPLKGEYSDCRECHIVKTVKTGQSRPCFLCGSSLRACALCMQIQAITTAQYGLPRQQKTLARNDNVFVINTYG